MPRISSSSLLATPPRGTALPPAEVLLDLLEESPGPGRTQRAVAEEEADYDHDAHPGSTVATVLFVPSPGGSASDDNGPTSRETTPTEALEGSEPAGQSSPEVPWCTVTLGTSETSSASLVPARWWDNEEGSEDDSPGRGEQQQPPLPKSQQQRRKPAVTTKPRGVAVQQDRRRPSLAWEAAWGDCVGELEASCRSPRWASADTSWAVEHWERPGPTPPPPPAPPPPRSPRSPRPNSSPPPLACRSPEAANALPARRAAPVPATPVGASPQLASSTPEREARGTSAAPSPLGAVGQQPDGGMEQRRLRYQSAPELHELHDALLGTREQVLATLAIQQAWRRHEAALHARLLARRDLLQQALGEIEKDLARLNKRAPGAGAGADASAGAGAGAEFAGDGADDTARGTAATATGQGQGLGELRASVRDLRHKFEAAGAAISRQLSFDRHRHGHSRSRSLSCGSNSSSRSRSASRERGGATGATTPSPSSSAGSYAPHSSRSSSAARSSPSSGLALEQPPPPELRSLAAATPPPPPILRGGRQPPLTSPLPTPRLVPAQRGVADALPADARPTTPPPPASPPRTERANRPRSRPSSPPTPFVPPAPPTSPSAAATPASSMRQAAADASARPRSRATTPSPTGEAGDDHARAAQFKWLEAQSS